MTEPLLRTLDARAIAARLDELMALLRDSVEHGASVGFMLPFDSQAARFFWGSVAESVAGGRTTLLGAFDGADDRGGALIGVVLLACETMPNQKHRGDIRKLMVHSAARKRGVGLALMNAIVADARDKGLELLVLDTATEAAERLYEKTGWTRVGKVPNFARNPDGTSGDTVFFYLTLR